MPVNSYSLKTNSKSRIEVSWLGFTYDGTQVKVALDGKEIGVIPDRAALTDGAAFSLPDGSVIQVKIFDDGLFVAQNGEALDCVNKTLQAMPDHFTLGSVDIVRPVRPKPELIDEMKRSHTPRQGREGRGLALAYGTVIFVGILYIALGILAVSLGDGLPSLYGYGALTGLLGLLFIVFGFLIRRRHIIPLIVVVALLGVDTVYYLISKLSAGAVTYAVVGTAVRGIIIFLAATGFGEFRKASGKSAGA